MSSSLEVESEPPKPKNASFDSFEAAGEQVAADSRGMVRRCLALMLPEDDKHRVEELMDLQIGFDESTYYLFTADKLPEIWTLHFIVEKVGFDQMLTYLTETVIPRLNDMILRDDSEMYSELIFGSPLLDDARRREEITLALNDDRGPLSDMASCGRCGADRVFITSKQTRSVDEGPTTLIECPVCKWSSKNTGQ